MSIAAVDRATGYKLMKCLRAHEAFAEPAFVFEGVGGFSAFFREFGADRCGGLVAYGFDEAVNFEREGDLEKLLVGGEDAIGHEDIHEGRAAAVLAEAENDHRFDVAELGAIEEWVGNHDPTKIKKRPRHEDEVVVLVLTWWEWGCYLKDCSWREAGWGSLPRRNEETKIAKGVRAAR